MLTPSGEILTPIGNTPLSRYISSADSSLLGFNPFSNKKLINFGNIQKSILRQATVLTINQVIPLNLKILAIRMF